MEKVNRTKRKVAVKRVIQREKRTVPGREKRIEERKRRGEIRSLEWGKKLDSGSRLQGGGEGGDLFCSGTGTASLSALPIRGERERKGKRLV